MLIDEVLAEYEASLRREVIVEAAAARVYGAIVTADLYRAPLLPRRLAGRVGADAPRDAGGDGGDPPPRGDGAHRAGRGRLTAADRLSYRARAAAGKQAKRVAGASMSNAEDQTREPHRPP